MKFSHNGEALSECLGPPSSGAYRRNIASHSIIWVARNCHCGAVRESSSAVRERELQQFYHRRAKIIREFRVFYLKETY